RSACRSCALPRCEAHVDDPTPAIRALDRLTTRASSPNGGTVRPLNPLSRTDRLLFEALLSRQPALHGFATATSPPRSPPPPTLQLVTPSNNPSGNSTAAPSSRPRLDRQDSTLASLARFSLRPSRHGRSPQAT